MKKIICNNKLLNSKCIFGILLFGVCLFSVSCDDKDTVEGVDLRYRKTNIIFRLLGQNL